MSEAGPSEGSADPVRRRRTAPTPRPSGTSKRARLRRVLASPAALRQAFLLREVLDPPVALREDTRRGP